MGAADAFDRLNERQREAVRFGARAADGSFRAAPLLVIAGAGTGKTSTLAHRVAHLLREGVAPERILLLTFTRRAAAEMTRRAARIAAGARGALRLAWAGTFHAVANRLIRRQHARVGLPPGFSVLDRADAADLMDVVRHELGLSRMPKRFPRKDTCVAICSHCVNSQQALAATLAQAFPWCAEWEAELARLFRAYVERKLAIHALDYDDLLLYWRAMLEDAALGREIVALWDHVLVDEYQDTNALQAAILAQLKPSGEGLTVVGDDAQAIYSFRAATVENILGFERRFGARVVTLEANYRSTQPVLDAANALLREAPRQYRKELAAQRGDGPRPRLVSVADDRAQADYVVTQVLERREQGVPLRQQAVLFRASHHADVLELELVRRNIPYVKYGGLKFLEAAHVKDVLAVLRWADNPRNRIAAWRALQLLPGVGPRTAERALAGFEASGWRWEALASGSAAFDALLTWLGDPATPWAGQMERVRGWYAPLMEGRYDDAGIRAAELLQLERIAASFGTREAFLTELALDPPQAGSGLAEAPVLDEDWLVLSSVHSAKGQEWEAVYVLDVTEGSFPSEFAAGDAALLEEERRLLYVAITRARANLDLVVPLKYYVTSQSRTGDRHVYGARSRFLTSAVVRRFDEVVWTDGIEQPAPACPGAPVDVASRLRELWT